MFVLCPGLIPMLRVFNATARYVDQCFTGETIVYTKSGPKPIALLQSGTDEVLTHTGQYHVVNALVKHEINEKPLEIVVKQATKPINVTEAHQVLALQGQPIDIDFDTLRHRLDKGLAQRQMVDAKDLQVGDFVCYPLPSVDTIADVPTMSEDDCRMYGMLVGGACSMDDDATSQLSLHGDATAIAFVRRYMSERDVALTDDFSWSSSSLGFKFGRQMVYADDNSKRVESRFINLPENKLLAIVRGVIDAAGHTLKGDEIVVEMSSPQVVESVRYMLMRAGIMSAGGDSLTSLSIPLVAEIAAMLPASAECREPSYLVHDGWMYSRIAMINVQPKSDVAAVGDEIPRESTALKVYDLEVDTDHTYVTQMGAVHNGGGKRKGTNKQQHTE